MIPTRGLAITAAMLHAIENGATTLDAYDVNGFLPDRYRQFDFQEIGREQFNSETFGEPSDELKAAWRLDGWKDDDPYPDIVYMKFGGKDAILDSFRRSARRNYLESWAVDNGATGSIERNTAGGLLYNDGRDSGATGTSGIQNTSSRAGWPDAQIRPDDSGRSLGPLTGFARRYRNLLGLSDERLISIDLSPWEVRTLPRPRPIANDRDPAPSVLLEQHSNHQTADQTNSINLPSIPLVLFLSNLASSAEQTQQPQRPPHVIPPSPSTPAGPTLTASAIAAHRAMRTAYLG